HEILRTRVVTKDGIGYQKILDPDLGFHLDIIDNTELKNEDIGRFIYNEIYRPFTSDQALCRGCFINLKAKRGILIITFHHIISDGWSMGIFNKEFSIAYRNYTKGVSPSLIPLPVQYVDYTIWQRTWLSGEILQKQLSYWKKQLSHALMLELPTDKSRPLVQSYYGEYYEHFITKDVFNKLQQLSQGEGVTLFMSLLAAFSAVLSKFSNQDDIVIGTPIAGRKSKDVEGLIGFFANTLALRIGINRYMTFKELLHRVEAVTLEAYEHQDVPFEQLVDHLNIQRDLSRHPIFQVMFILQNMEMSAISMDNLELSYEYSYKIKAKFDLTLNIVELPDSLYLRFEYAKDLFNEQTIVKLAKYYDQFINTIVNDVEQICSNISILDKKEVSQLKSFNNTDAEYPENKTVHELFEEVAVKQPDRTAIVYEDKQVSYGVLNNRANQLSHLLHQEGVRVDKLVGISAPRGIELVIGMLSILKAGGGYVPLDPEYPRERLNYMLKDADIDILLTVRKLSNLYKDYKGKIIYIDDYDDYVSKLTTSLDIATSPHALAYLIYTSGSTGKPKGVGVEQHALVNHMQWMMNQYFDGAKPYMLQRTSSNFDASVWEVFLPLLMAGKVVVTRGEVLKSPPEFKKAIHLHLIDTIQLVPSLINLLNEENVFKNLKVKRFFVGGERLTHEHISVISSQNPQCLVCNLYGPTEATIQVLTWRYKGGLDSLSVIPIGKPISNTEVYILDRNLNQIPIGAIGELYIGGVGLARGYLNRAGLTAERFIANPFCKKAGERLYKTGDLARYLSDGNIEYIGRIDQQVKIRGFRIELGEIESVISSVEGVKQCVVLAREDEAEQKKVVAYVVAKVSDNKEIEGEDKEAEQELIGDIRKVCAKNLPDYMEPSQVMVLKEMPLTPNGKIDRKGLPKPEGREGLEAYEAPEGKMEKALALIWKELLQVERVGRNDNFFHLGGHSLIATRLISKIRQNESIEVPLRAIFEYPVLCDLAGIIEQKYQETGILPPITKVERNELMPLSFAQQRLWFIEQLLDQESDNLYNMQTCIRICGALNIKALEKAIEYMVNRHAVFRTKIVVKGENVYQHIFKKSNFKLVHKDITVENIDTEVLQEITTPFNLSESLFRGLLLRISNLDYVLILTSHHIINDGWSIGVFNKEFSYCYNLFAVGKSPHLKELKIQYVDYAVWQRNWFKGEVLQKQLDYWKHQLSGMSSVDLSFKTRGKDSNYDAREYLHKISKKILDKLNSFTQAEGVTMFMTLLSAFKVVLSKYINQQDVAIGTPIANRRANETEGLIGFFVNTLVLRSSVGVNDTFRNFVQKIKKVVLGAYEHQDIPFEQLVENLNIDRDLSRHSLFQIFFVFQNHEISDIEMQGLEVSNILPKNIKKSIFDLALNAIELEDGLYINFEYSKDHFDDQYIREIANKYTKYIEYVVDNPDILLSNISILDKKEVSQLKSFN
ncbi:MAG: amino acid adenylation domain-containing protein, partial [Proteobacteria bacterium]|nr:amino acid adenylation domain-containing protein [Pseudomonadota bacterium]